MSGPAFEDDGLSSDDDDEEEENYPDTDELLTVGVVQDVHQVPEAQSSSLNLEVYTPQFEFSELKLSPLLIAGELPSSSTTTVASSSSTTTVASSSSSSTAVPSLESLGLTPKSAPPGMSFVTIQQPTPIDTQPNLLLPPSPITAEKKEKKSSFSALAKGIRRPHLPPRSSSSLGLTLTGSTGTRTPLSEPGSGTATPSLKPSATSVSLGTGITSKKRRPKFKRSKASEYNFATNSDILGIVMLEIISAENLPRLKNSKWVFSTCV
jgi:phosphatidylserine decarboxylase